MLDMPITEWGKHVDPLSICECHHWSIFLPRKHWLRTYYGLDVLHWLPRKQEWKQEWKMGLVMRALLVRSKQITIILWGDVTWERINSPCTNKCRENTSLGGHGRVYSLFYPFLLPSRLTECFTNMTLIHKSGFLTQCPGYVFMCPLPTYRMKVSLFFWLLSLTLALWA